MKTKTLKEIFEFTGCDFITEDPHVICIWFGVKLQDFYYSNVAYMGVGAWIHVNHNQNTCTIISKERMTISDWGNIADYPNRIASRKEVVEE